MILPIGSIAAFLIAAAPPTLAADIHGADRVRAHVEFLASDLLEGRDTGSRGHRIAANYVASEFRGLGLRPGGLNGSWFVDVPFRRAKLAATPAITLTLNGRKTQLAAGRDAAVRPSVLHRNLVLDAPMVFVGYGVRDARLGIDDYAGLNVRGKIVVALSSPVPGVPSDVAAHLISIQAQTAGEQGAAGFIQVDDTATTANQLQRFSTRPVIDWVDVQGRSSRAGAAAASIILSSALADRLFERAPKQLRTIRTEAATGKKIRGFALPASMTIDAKSAWEDFTSPEVVAVLPGADPRLAAEHVVLMAHLDHLGIKADATGGEDAIYNGALDNAAGVATMIEAARQFVESGKPPRRSVMFIANTGEEFGLLGASYFSTHPTVPAQQIVGLVDLDMPLLLYDFTDVVAFGSEHSTTARAVAAAGASMKVAVSPDPMPHETLFVRSDHYPFVKRGVPAVFLMTGYANGGKPVWQKFLADTYHTVKDDLAQPIHWGAAARFAELNYRIARNMADAGERPMWYAGDYFGETFAPTQPKARSKLGR
jgi:Zn-dependent M28 family amino/carboxypeptidase